MSSTTKGDPDQRLVDPEAAALFQRDWQIYRKMIDHNFLFHREAYAHLRQVLVETRTAPFRFLDIACGDATASVGALRGTAVAFYHGIDLSRAALDLAEPALRTLGCPYTLEQNEFAEALRSRTEPADVAWIGLSLHHFDAAGKLGIMREVRRILAEDGLFLIFENTSPDGEDREGWLERWDRQRAAWAAYSDDEWDAMQAHVHSSDIPETDQTWHRLGREAGFGSVTQHYATPSDLFRLYSFH